MHDIAQSNFFTYKTILEEFPNTILLLDKNYQVVTSNSATQKLTGYTSVELANKSILSLISPADQFSQRDLLHSVFNSGKKQTIVTSLINKLNIIVPVSLTISPVKNDLGDIHGLICAVKDINNEQLIQEKQGTLAAIIENSNDAIISKTLEGIITSWNKSAQSLFGYTAEEAIGKSIVMLIPEDRLHEEEHILNSIRRDQKVNHFQTYRCRKSGDIIPISLTISPIKDEKGNIIGVSKIARDISIEKQVVEKQTMLAAIIESSDDAIISKTLEGVITTWNKGAELIFGYTEEEVIGKHITILLPSYRLNEETTILESIRKGKKVDHFQTTRVNKKGEELNISLTVSPIKDIHGEIIGASKVARDITLQKRAEENIKKNTFRLEILNDIGKSINEILDVETILQKVIDASTSITGAAFGAFFYNQINAKGEVYMLHASSRIPKSAFKRVDLSKKEPFFEAIFSNRKVIRIDDVTKNQGYKQLQPYLGISKEYLTVASYMAVPVISTSGIVLGVLFFGHPDVGSFKEEHENFVVSLAAQAAVALDNSKLLEEVKALNNKKDEFIALATHELRTPLTSINGFLQVLESKIQQDSAKFLLDKALKQLAKLNKLFNDLFDISKVQAGKLQLHLEDFDLIVLFNEIIESYKQTVKTHEIVFKALNTVMIQGDRLRLEQVITNLINNAIKYSPNAGQINLLVEKQNDKINVQVKDYGIGISKENLQQIFTQFFRVKNLNSTISGLGLGLYITKEIVERHHGKINVESEPEKGSTFSITIPLQQPN